MQLEDFKISLSASSPPAELSKPLQALWYAGNENWIAAHNIAQNLHSEIGSWIHGYLHRKEGDIENASYWYCQAGMPIAKNSFQEEWEQIVKAVLTVG